MVGTYTIFSSPLIKELPFSFSGQEKTYNINRANWPRFPKICLLGKWLYIHPSQHIYTPNTLFNVKSGNAITICKICSKLTIPHQNNVNYVFLVSLLLTMNRFHTLLWCFHCWLWTNKCWVGHSINVLMKNWRNLLSMMLKTSA